MKTIAQLHKEILAGVAEETMICSDFVTRMEALNEDSVHISESVTPVSVFEVAYWRAAYAYQATHPERDTEEVLSHASIVIDAKEA